MRKKFPGSKILPVSLIIVCFAIAAFQQSYKIGDEQIKAWDEASTAKRALEMLQSKSYFIVLNNGIPDHLLPKPPLTLWAVVLSYKLFGVTEFAVRFPTIIASWMTMLVLVLFTFFYLKEPHAAWLILLLIATTGGYMFYHVARNGDPDAMLIFFITCCILTYFIILEEEGNSKTVYFILFGLSVFGATFTKGIAGVAPLIGPAIYTFISRKGRKLLVKPKIHIAWMTALMLILTYYLVRNHFDHGYLKAVYNKEIKLLVLPYNGPEHRNFLYYFYLKKLGFRTLLFMLPLAIIPIIFGKEKRLKRLLVYTLTGALLFLIGESISLTKTSWYIAPIYPFLWISLAISLLESYRIVINKISNSIIKYSFGFLIIALFIYLLTNEYMEIYNRNQYPSRPDAHVYLYEQSGKYLRDLKIKHPGYKNIDVIESRYPRVLQFYANKYAYEDGSRITIYRNVPEDLNNKLVLTCEDKFKKEIESEFKYSLIDSGRYGKLYYIRGIKN